MVQPELYWVRDVKPHRLAIMPRPSGGEWLADDVAGWQRAAIGTVVSLLESHEIQRLELQAQAALCERSGIEFLHHPIVDHGLPVSDAELVRLVHVLHQRLLQGGPSRSTASPASAAPAWWPAACCTCSVCRARTSSACSAAPAATRCRTPPRRQNGSRNSAGTIMGAERLAEPEWNDTDSVALALEALRQAHDDESAIDACDRFLWSVGDNETGSFYPVVLSALPELEQILATGRPWAQGAAIEALVDLGGTFAPQSGHELHLGVPVQDALRAFIVSLRPRVALIAEAAGPRAASATELLDLIDDLSD
jgi:hypothetical protein